MRQCKKLLSIISIVVLTVFLPVRDALAGNTAVNMAITAGTITIGEPASLTFSTSLTASFSAQTLQQAFTGASNYFWVQDLKGTDSWYNTTLQLSGNLTAWSAVISWSNVLFQAAWGINVVSWSTNPRVTLDAWTAGFQAMNSARSFIRRNTQANFWVIGYYGANIELRIDVPAGQAAWSYAGTIVYTLIEN